MSDETAILKAELERKDAIIALLLEKISQLESNSSQPRSADGNIYSISSLPRTAGGNNYAISSHPGSADGNSYSSTSHPGSSDGKDVSISSPEEEKIILNKLYSLLLDGELHRCNRASVWAASKTLLHLYQRPINTHKHLQVISGLSEKSIAKHIHKLKRRQLIVRTGFQEYHLTPKAVAFIEQAAAA